MFEFSGVTSLLAVTLGVAVLLRFIYTTIVKNWNYFTDRNIVFERGLPGLGTILGDVQSTWQKTSIAERMQKLYNKHSGSKFIGMYEMGGRPSYLICDPDLIRDITVKDFDSFMNSNFRQNPELDPLLGKALFSMWDQPWREMRSTMSPLFTGSKMRFMLPLMIDVTQDFNTFIRNDIKSKSKTNSMEYDMMNLMMRLANDIIGSTAFGLQINTLKEPENEFYKMGTEVAYSILGFRTLVQVGFPKIASWLKVKILSDRHDRFFRDVIHSIVEQRQKQNIVRNDMVQLMLLAKEGRLNQELDKEKDQDTGFATVSEFMTAKTTEKLKSNYSTHPYNNKRIMKFSIHFLSLDWTEEDLVAQCVVFFLAGFTGISTVFCLLCYELSMNPEIQDRLYEEIVETKDHLNGKQLTFEVLQKMKYMDMVVSELLRKWPLSPLSRTITKPYTVEQNDGSKVVFEPGHSLWIPTFAIHRDPKLYPNPEMFDPERFSEENKKNINPYAYLPFGSGPSELTTN